MTISSFEFHNQKIGYQKTGTGPAVILLHGFGEDRHIFKSTNATLEKKYCVLTPDLLGTGISAFEPNSIPPNFSIEYLADSIAALLRQENIAVCFMLGHSMGGYITMAFAKKYPQHLTGFGLLHSTASPDTLLKIENRKRSITFIEAHGAALFLATTIPNLFGTHAKENQYKIIDSLIHQSASFSASILVAYYHAMIERPDLTRILEATNLPVLFILGTEDIAVALDDTLPQTKMPKTAYLYVLENCGHMGMLEQPNSFNNAILDFLDKVNA